MVTYNQMSIEKEIESFEKAVVSQYINFTFVGVDEYLSKLLRKVVLIIQD